MLIDRATIEIIVKKLDAVSELQQKHTDDLQSVNINLVSFKNTISYLQRTVTETLTYVRRVQPFISKAMGALHQAFKMLSNGILNLREETSEAVGTIIHDSDLLQHV
jgi:prophage DNA circulation protein